MVPVELLYVYMKATELGVNSMFVINHQGHIDWASTLDWFPKGQYWDQYHFLLYVNEIYLIAPNLSFIQYADDTNMFSTGPSLNNIFQ